VPGSLFLNKVGGSDQLSAQQPTQRVGYALYRRRGEAGKAEGHGEMMREKRSRSKRFLKNALLKN
jgi:hypothetical protein